jgi:predicted anti-sigma-YlaC factor YlaD
MIDLVRGRMDCQRTREAVSLDLDGKLSEFERAFLDAHIARCGACADYRHDVVALTSLVRAQPLEPLGHGVTLTHASRASRRRSLRLGTRSAAAALVLVGILASTQFAASPPMFSLRPGSSNVAASTLELKQIYNEVNLIDHHGIENVTPTGRVR